MIDQQNLSVKIQVDGGVTLQNAKSIVDAASHVLVTGNTFFKAIDKVGMIRALKGIV